MESVDYQKDRVINRKVNTQFPEGEEMAIMRKAIFNIARGHTPGPEFMTYYKQVTELVKVLPNSTGEPMGSAEPTQDELIEECIIASKQYLDSRGYHLDTRETLAHLRETGNAQQIAMSDDVLTFIGTVQEDLMSRMVAIVGGDLNVSMDFSNNDAIYPGHTWLDLIAAGIS